jgi:hypothetical protein
MINVSRKIYRQNGHPTYFDYKKSNQMTSEECDMRLYEGEDIDYNTHADDKRQHEEDFADDYYEENYVKEMLKEEKIK